MSERFVLPHLREMGGSLYRELIAKARGVEGALTLLAGDPDFETPKHIREAAARALEEGWTHYPVTGGMPDLKEALAEYHGRYGSDWDPASEVIVTPGSTPALFLSFVGTLNRGDEVILFDPYYMGYQPIIDYLNLRATLVHLKEEERYHLDIGELRRSVTPRTRMLVICSPNNPTGTVFTEDELSGIAEVAEENDLLILSDEIYDQFVWDGRRHRSISALPGMRERTIVIMSFSKTFAMTGWRLGSIMADEPIASGLRRIPIGGRPATFIQKAGVAALKGPWEPVEEFRREYIRRRDFLVKRLNEVEGVSCVSPEGAFYLFPNLEAVGQKSLELCAGLLDEQRLAAVPGVAFGPTGEYHLRLPLVKPVEYLAKCADALEEYVESHLRAA